mgnify:CR=1 FL=1
MKEIHELEELRNSDDEVRSFKKVDGKVGRYHEEDAHPEGCTCGHCSQDHSHEGHVHAHSHGDGEHAHNHEHNHEHSEDCCFRRSAE